MSGLSASRWAPARSSCSYSAPASTQWRDGSTFEGWGGLTFLTASLAFATVGAMVAARVPENPIGWIFCLTGLILGLADFANQFADQMLFIASDPWPGGRTAAWLQQLGLAPALACSASPCSSFLTGASPPPAGAPCSGSRWSGSA